MKFTWGTVTAINPLRIQLDGDTVALPITPDSLVDPLTLAVADRVRVEMSVRRAVIVGRSQGTYAGPWVPFTFTVTNLTIGNGTVAASSRKVGGMRHIKVDIVFGSTTSMGSTPFFNLPTTATVTKSEIGTLYNRAGFDVYAGMLKISTSTANLITTADAYLTATVPFTWAANDSISIRGSYFED